MTPRMATAAELAAIAARESKASEGPWRTYKYGVLDANGVEVVGDYTEGFVWAEDEEFVVEARQDIPTLLAHIAYLHGLLAEKRRQGKRGGPLAGRIILMCDQHELQWDHTEPPERCLDCEIDALLTEHGREEEGHR